VPCTGMQASGYSCWEELEALLGPRLINIIVTYHDHFI
jgi:hypothetical protein